VAEQDTAFVFPNLRYVDVANDGSCGIYEANYLLMEENWPGVGEDHNPDFSSFVFDTVENHILYTPLQNNQIQSYDSNGNVICDLGVLGTQSCTLEFRMYYKTMNVTLSTLVAHSQVTVVSECIKMSYAENRVSVWFWDDVTASNGDTVSAEDIMEVGFSLEQGQQDGTGIISFVLPYSRPSLGTDTDFASILGKCGQIEYDVINVDDATLTTFTYPSDSYGVVTVYANTTDASF
jgi:hypothetical protein